jgi:hypothetical protein
MGDKILSLHTFFLIFLASANKTYYLSEQIKKNPFSTKKILTKNNNHLIVKLNCAPSLIRGNLADAEYNYYL